MIDYIILGAGKPYSGKQHTALRNVENSAHVLDWSTRSVSFLEPNFHFVSGYQAEEVESCYPNFRYTYNADWNNTRSGWSFLCALPNTPNDTIVSYSDILFHEATVRALFDKVEGDVVVAIDSHWRSRYTGRNIADLQRCEKVCLADDLITYLGSDIDISQASAEFIGLARFSSKAVEKLNQIKKLANVQDLDFLKQANLSHLIERLRILGLKITAIDVHGDWAELNEPADLARFILGTKAQTLQRLKSVVRSSRIEDQVSFTVEQWMENHSIWLSEIKKVLGDGLLIVRSSALSEDGFLCSSAGVYTSILNVQGCSRDEVLKAVTTVIESYPDDNPSNEVLIQPMLNNVSASGVVFTRSLTTGAPYYVVNYDDVSGSTESITDGTSQEDKTLIIRRDAGNDSISIPHNLKSLLPALREIEALLGYDSLDIEFAITEEFGLHILQVRPIAVDHSYNKASDRDFYTLISEAEKSFARQQYPSPFILGKKAIFGIMPDWNPAEIIGTKPNILATSLYQSLILDETWATQRKEYGYRDVRPQPLLICFSGHPYINIRASFNSFMPANLSDTLAEKIIDFGLDWLQKRPELHDKVEFDVIPTCFDLHFSRWSERLLNGGKFNQAEVNTLRESLITLTNNALRRNKKDMKVIEKLDERFNVLKESALPPLEKSFALLEDARRYGTLPFSHLARSAFVAVSLLRSAVTVGIITEQERDDFLNTIRTVSQDLTFDSLACASGELSWDSFIEKYGHLRPGTYDIASLSYKHDAERYLRPIVDRIDVNQSADEEEVGVLWASAREKFCKAIIESGLEVNVDEIESFMREAIEGREYAKFSFTRNLSLALDEITSWGEEQGIDSDTLSNLSVDELRLLSRGTIVTKDVGEWITIRARENQQYKEVTDGIELPPLICRKEDFSVFLYPKTNANYIGSNCVIASSINIENNQGIDMDLEGKIILIPKADPGYDWLFGRNIGGLITMYGGANSHMAIRAAEFGIPAAIGIGENHYRALAGASELELNASKRVIRIIH